MTTTIVGAAGAMLGSSTMEAKGFTVANFAFYHFKSASLCRDHVLRIEAEHRDQPFGAFFEEIMSYTSSCILTSAAALEALINEIFVTHDSPVRLAYGDDFKLKFWGPLPGDEKSIEMLPPLVKYDLALAKLGLKPFAKGDRVYQNARALIALRNEFVHFKPDWDRRRLNLAAKLRGKFKLSPFVGGDGNDFLAMRCMSGDCARWSVETVRAFVREFRELTGTHFEKTLNQIIAS